MARRGNSTIRRYRTLFTVAALLTCAGFLAYKIYAVSLERYQINKQISTGSEKLQELDAQSKDLKALVARLKDPTYLEKEARKKLNVQLPGEQTVIITGQTAKDSAKAGSAGQSALQQGALANARQWFAVLFGK